MKTTITRGALVRALALSSFLGSLAGCGAAPKPPVAVGRPAATAAGLPAAEGEVTVVGFFTTWCPASAEMLRALDGIRARNLGTGLVTMAFNEGATQDGLDRFVAARKVQSTVRVDVDGRLAAQLELPTLPSLVVIDRQGVIRHLHAGYRGAGDLAVLATEIDALLGERAPGDAPNRAAPGHTDALAAAAGVATPARPVTVTWGAPAPAAPQAQADVLIAAE
jgi:hypothetical protein